MNWMRTLSLLCVALATGFAGYAIGRQFVDDPPPKPVWMISTSSSIVIALWRKFSEVPFPATFIIEGPMEEKGKVGEGTSYEIRRKDVAAGTAPKEITLPNDLPNYYSITYGTFQWRFSVKGRVILRGKFNSRFLKDFTRIVTIYPTRYVSN